MKDENIGATAQEKPTGWKPYIITLVVVFIFNLWLFPEGDFIIFPFRQGNRPVPKAIPVKSVAPTIHETSEERLKRLLSVPTTELRSVRP